MSEWWLPSDPDDIKAECWLHPAAVLYLESLLTPEMSVIEHGCGGSTLWFAERVKDVKSFDKNKAWVNKMREIAPYNARVSKDDCPQEMCDFMFIDGYNRDRPEWMFMSDKYVKEGGIIVLDNADRPHYQEGRRHLLTFCHSPLVIAATTGLGKFVVTEFYRVKGGTNWI